MKRALLIAGGTVGGLGAVLVITPPQFTTTQDAGGLAGSLGTNTGSTQPSAAQATTVATTTHSSAAPVVTKSTATKKAAATKSAQATAQASSSTSATASQSASATPTPSATKTTAAPSANGYSGTVTGASFNARNYGTLSATVTFTNGKIANVSASQSPRSWSENSLSALLPFVNGGKISVEQVKQFSAAQLPCATQNSCRSQASFTAEAFWSSVKSAITKAGL